MSQQASKHIAQNGAWTVNAHAVSIVRPTPSMDSDPTRTQGRHTSTWRPLERGFACVKRSTWVRFSFIPSVRLLHWVFTSKGSFVPMAVPLPAAPGSCCARGVMWVVARFIACLQVTPRFTIHTTGTLHIQGLMGVRIPRHNATPASPPWAQEARAGPRHTPHTHIGHLHKASGHSDASGEPTMAAVSRAVQALHAADDDDRAGRSWCSQQATKFSYDATAAVTLTESVRRGP